MSLPNLTQNCLLQQDNAISEEQQRLAIETHQNNLVLLAKGLTNLVLHLPSNHPDIKRVYEVLEFICRYSERSLSLFFTKVIQYWPNDTQKSVNVIKLLFNFLTELEFHKDFSSEIIVNSENMSRKEYYK